MNTNSVPYLDQVLKINDALLGLPALPLVAVGCLAAGYFFKAIPIYKNRWIPAGVFACGVILNVLITPLDSVPSTARAVILGLVAGGLSWVAHRKLLSKWLDEAEFTNGDTTHITKPPTDPKP